MAKEELAPKVYFLTFSKPRYVSEIGELIYGIKKETYPKIMGKKRGAIYKCLTEGLIEDVTESIELPKEKKPGFEKRKYYKAKVDPLISALKTKISLDSFDEYILRQILDSTLFRYLVGNLKIDLKEELNPITYIFMQLDWWATFYLKNNFLSTIGHIIDNKFKNKKEYDFFIHEILKTSKETDFKETIKQLREFNPKDPFLNVIKNKEEEQDIYEIIKASIPFYIAPKSLMEKIKGITIIGQMDSLFSSLYGQADDTNNFVRYLESKMKNVEI